MSTHDDLVAQTAELEALIADGPKSVDALGGVVLVRWHMRHADELRRIREALERLARFAPDSVESGD